MDDFRYVGDTPTDLQGGRPIEPGEFTGPIDISDDSPQNKLLYDEGKLVKAPSEQEREKAAKDAERANGKAEAAATTEPADEGDAGKDGEGS